VTLTYRSRIDNLASNATSASASDPAFQHQASTELSGFHTNFVGFTSVLAELGGGNGVANLDPTNNLETLLESIINANKDILTVTYNLVVSLPIVGPILGPSKSQLFLACVTAMNYLCSCVQSQMYSGRPTGHRRESDRCYCQRDPTPPPGCSRQGCYGDVRIWCPGCRSLHIISG
jgi:hypothetical protein